MLANFKSSFTVGLCRTRKFATKLVPLHLKRATTLLCEYKRSTVVILLVFLTQCHRFVSEHQHMSALESYKMLKMPSFDMNTCSETFVPLIHCVINDTLSQAMTHLPRMLLQFIDVMNLMSVTNVCMQSSMPKDDILAFNVRPLSRAAATFPAGANQIRLAARRPKFGWRRRETFPAAAAAEFCATS